MTCKFQRELVDMRTGQSGLVDGRNLTLRETEHEKGKVFPVTTPLPGEPGEGVGQSVALSGTGPSMMWKWRCGASVVARIADQREHLAGHDLVAG